MADDPTGTHPAEPAAPEPLASPQPGPPPGFAAIPVVFAIVILATQGYLALGRNFSNLLETPFVPYCLLGAFAIHMASRPSRAECLATFALAIAAICWFVALCGKFRPTTAYVVAAAGFSGLASLTVIAIQVLRHRGQEQTGRLNTLLAGSVFGMSALIFAGVLEFTTRLHPQTYDLYLYFADQGFGLPFCAWTGHFLAHRPALSRVCGLVYESLPLALSLLYAYQRGGSHPLPIRVLPAFLGGGLAVYLLYNILPAAGPLYIFGAAFPDHLPLSPGLHLAAIGSGARNAIPSMHVACVLLVFWNCRRISRWAYAAAGFYLACTALACLGFGEHYLIDLVAGVPFALALQAVCAPATLRALPEWKQSIAVGLALTLIWIATVRFAVSLFHIPAFPWALSLVTLAVCALARRRMLPAEARYAATP